MLGTVATVAVVTIEIGLVGYNLHKQGAFKAIYNKFAKQARDVVKQPKLKEIQCMKIQ